MHVFLLSGPGSALSYPSGRLLSWWDEQVQSLVSEPFWYIYLALSRPREDEEEKVNVFSWKRGNLFDYDVAYMLYEMVLERSEARVTKVTNKNVKKWYV